MYGFIVFSFVLSKAFQKRIESSKPGQYKKGDTDESQVDRPSHVELTRRHGKLSTIEEERERVQCRRGGREYTTSSVSSGSWLSVGLSNVPSRSRKRSHRDADVGTPARLSVGRQRVQRCDSRRTPGRAAVGPSSWMPVAETPNVRVSGHTWSPGHFKMARCVDLPHDSGGVRDRSRPR